MTQATKPAPPKTYITGFCAVGQHEKTTLVSPKGLKLRACTGKYLVSSGASVYGRMIEVICNCGCHTAFREIADMLGLLDDMHGFGGSVADVGVKENPTPTVLAPAGVLPVPNLLGPLPPVTPPPLNVTPEAPTQLLPFQKTGFKPTPTGRAARGQLEEQIRIVVKAYHEIAAEMLTPEMIGRFVNKEQPPSNGAIHACLTRWSDRGWVTLLKKPFRLGVITEGGKPHLLK